MWEGIASPEQAQILTLLAELCMFTAQISNPSMAAENVYKLLLVSQYNMCSLLLRWNLIFFIDEFFNYNQYLFIGILATSAR